MTRASHECELVCQKRVSRVWSSNYIPQYIWDVITCSCPCPILAHKSPHMLHDMIFVIIYSQFSQHGGFCWLIVCMETILYWYINTENYFLLSHTHSLTSGKCHRGHAGKVQFCCGRPRSSITWWKQIALQGVVILYDLFPDFINFRGESGFRQHVRLSCTHCNGIFWRNFQTRYRLCVWHDGGLFFLYING